MNPLGKGNKPGGPKFSFNFYWIYAILIIVIFAVNFMDWGGKPREVTWNQFEKEMLRTHDVESVEVVNKERVNVYIKKEKLSEEKYKPVSSKALSKSANEGPHFYFTIGDVATFEKNMDKARRTVRSACTAALPTPLAHSGILIATSVSIGSQRKPRRRVQKAPRTLTTSRGMAMP